MLDGRRVTLVTDSTASLPDDLVRRYAIVVVPLQVVIAGRPGLEGVEVSAEQVVAALPDRTKAVSTLPPDTRAFVDAFRRAAAGGRQVVCVTISSALSATYEVACSAAGTVAAEGVVVRVVDSRATAMQLGFTALAGARTAAIGGSVDEVVTVCEAAKQRTRALFYVDTLEYLRRNGRIGAAQKLIGTALRLKPLLTVQDGVVAPLERQRGTEKGLRRLEELVVEASQGDRVEVCLHHVGAPDRAEELSRALRQALGPTLTDLHTTDLSAVVGVHVGPGAVGAVVRRLQ